MNKKQKTLLITGGLGGIGLEIVEFFYKKNFKIIILDNKSKKRVFVGNLSKPTLLHGIFHLCS